MREGRPPIKELNLIKGRLLEVPVFLTLEKALNKQLGKPILAIGGPTADGQKWNEQIWVRQWKGYMLHYYRKPQHDKAKPYPDIILYKAGNRSVLAVEVKNYTKGTKFTQYTYNRDVIRYLEWLPPKCARKLVCSYRDIIESDHDQVIHDSSIAKIDCLELNIFAGKPNPKWVIYKRLGHILPVWVKRALEA